MILQPLCSVLRSPTDFNSSTSAEFLQEGGERPNTNNILMSFYFRAGCTTFRALPQSSHLKGNQPYMPLKMIVSGNMNTVKTA